MEPAKALSFESIPALDPADRLTRVEFERPRPVVGRRRLDSRRHASG